MKPLKILAALLAALFPMSLAFALELEKTEGVWSLMKEGGENRFFASTAPRDDGFWFSRVCDVEICAYHIFLPSLKTPMTCVNGESAYLLFSTGKHSYAAKAVCLGLHSYALLKKEDNEVIDAMILRGSMLSIAVPKLDGGFYTPKISLSGAIGIIDEQEKRIVQIKQEPSEERLAYISIPCPYLDREVAKDGRVIKGGYGCEYDFGSEDFEKYKCRAVEKYVKKDGTEVRGHFRCDIQGNIITMGKF